MSETFWLQNPKILLAYAEFWPQENMSFERKLNAITRLIIVLSLLGYLYTRNRLILLTCLITLGIIIFIYNQRQSLNKEGFNLREVKPDANIFYESSAQNPLGNVLLPEINDNPKRNEAPPSFSNNIHKNINENVKKMVQSQNPDIENIDERLFNDLGDNVQFHNSMIPFNSNPSTQIPNDQNAFAHFCYGNMPSCKTGDKMACAQKVGSYLAEN